MAGFSNLDVISLPIDESIKTERKNRKYIDELLTDSNQRLQKAIRGVSLNRVADSEPSESQMIKFDNNSLLKSNRHTSDFKSTPKPQKISLQEKSSIFRTHRKSYFPQSSRKSPAVRIENDKMKIYLQMK